MLRRTTRQVAAPVSARWRHELSRQISTPGDSPAVITRHGHDKSWPRFAVQRSGGRDGLIVQWHPPVAGMTVADGNAVQKDLKAMQDSELRKLDKRSIAIELAVRDQKSVFKGVGHFDDHGKNGPALRVEIQHPLGNFAIQLRTNEWQGEIESGEKFGCEFLLHLNAASLHQDKTLSDS
jgi:hypothetical protein